MGITFMSSFLVLKSDPHFEGIGRRKMIEYSETKVRSKARIILNDNFIMWWAELLDSL